MQIQKYVIHKKPFADLRDIFCYEIILITQHILFMPILKRTYFQYKKDPFLIYVTFQFSGFLDLFLSKKFFSTEFLTAFLTI